MPDARAEAARLWVRLRVDGDRRCFRRRRLQRVGRGLGRMQRRSGDDSEDESCSRGKKKSSPYGDADLRRRRVCTIRLGIALRCGKREA